jgi:hypothetical protein
MKTSTSGYKRNSKDRNEPALRIPSSSITMKDVPHPVMAILDNGSKHIMYPEQDYKFKTSSVVEVPIKQKGGIIMKNKLKPKDINKFESYVADLTEQVYVWR